MHYIALSPDTAAASRLLELIELVAKATPMLVADYVQAHYSPKNAAREQLDKRIGFFMDWKTRGGIKIIKITKSEASYIETVVEQPFTGENWIFAVQTENKSPYRIHKLLIGRAPLPIIQPSSGNLEVAESIITYTRKLASADLFSGAVLVARNGHILAQNAFGLANRDFSIPNNLQTRFNVASLTKSWTAVAIAQMVEVGELSFKDNVAKFIDYPDAESAARIHIEHLLSHTSGLLSYFTDEFYQKARHHIRTVDDYLALSKDQRPEFKPGSRWKYSNTGMVLLGKIIEIVTGRSYFDHVKTNVLDRGGMKDAGFLELDRVNDNVAVGYGKKWSVDGCEIVNNVFENFVGGCPAGGGYATVLDIYHFAQALLNGDLISMEMVNLLTTPKPELNSPDYGYGFSIHTGRALFGHSGGMLGASSNLDIVNAPPGWVIVVLANDLSMRAPTLKARQLIGVSQPETEAGRTYLPNAGITAR